MIRAGHTDYAERYLASSTWRRARARERRAVWFALAAVLLAAGGALWGLHVVLQSLPVMTD